MKKDKIPMHFKTGFGYDIHHLVKGRKLFLGGVEIPHEKGLEGHSDADVLLHAICDALLGAVGKGDIGEHFPNTDPKYKGISSLVLLEKVRKVVEAEGYSIGNVDTMILAQEPNLKSYKPKMRETIAKSLGIDLSCVNIKATTQEGVGFGSTHEAIAAYATVLIFLSSPKALVPTLVSLGADVSSASRLKYRDRNPDRIVGIGDPDKIHRKS